MLFILRQVVGDREPRCLGADENMFGRADGRTVDESSHGNVNKGAGADQRVEERAAHLTVRIVTIFIAKNHEIVLTLADDQLFALYTGERLEGRTGRPPAIRAVAVRGVDELVRHGVVDRAANN